MGIRIPAPILPVRDLDPVIDCLWKFIFKFIFPRVKMERLGYFTFSDSCNAFKDGQYPMQIYLVKHSRLAHDHCRRPGFLY